MFTSFGETLLRNRSATFGSELLLADGPIDLSWHHCGTTAEFIGELFALRSRAERLDYNNARSSIGYLVNELLENAVKFRARGDVAIATSLESGRFEIRVKNAIGEETAERFQTLLAGMEGRDPGELLIERIEANAEDAGSSGSGLGLLTLMSDYGARLGWIFTKTDADAPVWLETVAALDLA